MTRQRFIHAGAALVAAPLGVVACAPADRQDSYETAVNKIWRPLSGPFQGELALRQELVRYATQRLRHLAITPNAGSFVLLATPSPSCRI